MKKIYDWNKFTNSNIHKQIIHEWEILLSNTKLKEKDYHAFLMAHPGIFLTGPRSYLVVSKLKLGSFYETDFVIVNEGFSEGTQYNLIEIETPHTKLFDSSGKPTAKLNSALQQIRDWRRFLIDHRTSMKNAFPTLTTRVMRLSKLTFTIIIGRRTGNLEILEKRNQIADNEKIKIVSYDRLTDLAKIKFFPIEPHISCSELDHMPYHMRNELANPFYQCISDSVWKSINKEGHYHIYDTLLEQILKHRKYNKYFNIFKQMYQDI